MILFIYYFLFVFFAVTSPAKARSVFVGVNADFSLPLLNYTDPLNNPKIEGGILKEEATAICNELHVSPIWILLPKSRVGEALISGKVDLICHTNEAWWKKSPKTVLWSREIYPSKNVLVA